MDLSERQFPLLYKEKNKRVYSGGFIESLGVNSFAQCEAQRRHRTHVSWHCDDSISDRFPGNADAVGLGPYFEN